MDAPPVHYVTTSDGYSIAYAVCGSGTPYVFLPGAFTHVQFAWQHPWLSRWLEALAQRYKVVQFDPRGTGLSSRGLPSDFSPDDQILDLEAVADELALQDFVLHASAGVGCYVAVNYATHHPQSVAALILSAAAVTLEGFRAPSLWASLPAQDWDTFLYSSLPRNLDGETRDLLVRLMRQAFNQSDYLVRVKAMTGSSLEEGLRNLTTPTLILHPRDFAGIGSESAAKVAQLARARLALIDGSFTYGDAETGLRAIERFLADLPPAAGRRGPERSLPAGLSAREAEVLRLIAAGRSNQQVADELVISLNTVRRHVSNIFAKTGAANRADAVSYAHRQGLISSS